MTKNSQKISIENVLELIIRSDAVVIDDTPASLDYYASSEDIEDAKENNEGIILAKFSYSKIDFIETAELCSSHKAELTKDRSTIILKDEKGSQMFSISFLYYSRIVSQQLAYLENLKMKAEPTFEHKPPGQTNYTKHYPSQSKLGDA